MTRYATANERPAAQFASLLVPTFVLALFVLMKPDGVRADDAYVCDGGRLVYARPETLEKLKATDPCIAAYHGLALGQASAKEPRASDGAVGPGLDQRGASAATNALNRAPARAAKPRDALQPTFQKIGYSDPQAIVAPLGSTTGNIKLDPNRAPAVQPSIQVSPDTDFRNVRLLNAAPGAAAIFRHTR